MKSHRLGFLVVLSIAVAGLSLPAFQSKESAAHGLKLEPPWRVHDPIHHANLTIFPVTGSYGPVAVDYLTLDEGLRTGEVEVTELGAGMSRRRPGAPRPPSAQVNRLTLFNHSKRPLLLLAGEIVTGGKQDRVVSSDRIVPPGSELPLDVFCVEPGRWNNATTKFNASMMMAAPNIRQKAAVARNQQEVWAANDAVREGVVGGVAETVIVSGGTVEAARGALARSSSYAVLEQNRELKSAIDTVNDRLQGDYEKALKHSLGAGKVTGVVIAINGRVVWADLFAEAELFDHYWPKLLRSYVVEAMSVADTDDGRRCWHEGEKESGKEEMATRGCGAATVDDARAFLYRDDGRQLIEIEPGEYKLVRVDHPRYDVFRLYSLWEKNEPLVHLSKLRKEASDRGKLELPQDVQPLLEQFED